MQANVPWRIRPFQPADQTAVQTLILAGLAEHWGELDPTLNRDLDDIISHYVHAGHHFFVIEEAELLLGAGGLWREAPDVWRIVRVAIAPDQRRRGLGRAITEHLIQVARQQGGRQLVVETTDSWTAAIALYLTCGFQPYAHHQGDIHLALTLSHT